MKKKTTDGWLDVAALTALEEGGRTFEIGGKTVLILRSGEEIRALGAVCPHHGAPLEHGLITDHLLTCPWHTAAFDVETGRLQNPPALEDLDTYEVKIARGRVLVRRKKEERKDVQLRRESGTFIILGSGAAGTAAAFTLRREGFDGRVIVVTSETAPPYDRTRLSKEYLSEEFERQNIYLMPETSYRDLKIDLLQGRQVVEVDHENKRIIFMDGDYLQYDKLLVATGGIPRTPLIPGTDLKNFFLLRNLDDANSIHDAMGRVGTALIIGAGFLGLETAAALRTRGLEVHVVAPEKAPLSHVYGARISARVRHLHEERGVRFHLGLHVLQLKGDDSVHMVELSDENTLAVDMVIAAIGILPAVHFLESSGLVENNAVSVDSRLKTKFEDIYAAGDIALVPDFPTGGKRRVEHWTEAMRQGCHAARCMLGSEDEYRGIPFFWSKQYDTVIRYAGYTPKVRRIVYRGEPEEGDFLAGYFRGKKLLAVAGIGRTEEFLQLNNLLGSSGEVRVKQFRCEEFSFAGHAR
jgi:NADPH-dependent 2,4-dienoyl-CoA reductase/sulfur reductase-like enzyme/nitrite reductase/ring-hydroxylating ferredoxin subunit